MQTILLAWNPEKFKWGNLQDELTSVKNKDSKHNRWSVGNARLAVKNGDRFFLIRLGSAPKGIVASGSIISDPYQAPHWNGEGGVALFVDIIFEHLNETPIISWEELQEPPLEFRWGIQQSGVRVPPPIAEELTALFKKRINKPGHPFSAYSWEVISEEVAIKQMDKSAFLHHGTGIPKDTAFFFDLPEEGLSKAIPITLKLDETNYSAHIEMDAPYARFRLFWKSDLSNAIKKRFPEIHRAFKSDENDVKAPNMRFERHEKNSYSVSFENLPVPVAPPLKRATRDREYTLYQPDQRGAVIFSYLTEGISHRELDDEILHLDKEYSRGYQSMGILHYLGLADDYKGLLQGRSLPEVLEFCRTCTSTDLTHLLGDLSALHGASPETEESLIKEFEQKVAVSKKDTSAKRKQRLSKAETRPQAVSVLTTAYKRNPDVVAEVLSRANGICELCDNPAPFMRKKDREPYLEVHHKIQLADGGGDTVENAVAACPNCHRKAHYGV